MNSSLCCTSKTQPIIKPEQRESLLPLYRVILHDDNDNCMDYVIFILREVFKFTESYATEVMLEAHTSGMAICVIEPLEYAEFHRELLGSSNLTASVAPDL